MQIEYAKGMIKAKNAMEIKNMQKIYNRDYSEYPLVFFDFETFMYPVPLVENSHPWEQICCQSGSWPPAPDRGRQGSTRAGSRFPCPHTHCPGWSNRG